MYRAAASRLRTLKGRGGSPCLRRFASSSALAKNQLVSSDGMFSWFLGGKPSSPPLDFPIEGITVNEPLPDFVEPGKTQITELSNGVIVASEDAPGPGASIGLYVDCGSMYENSKCFGATHMLERMAFKTTTNRSHLRIVREVEAIGGSMSANATREHMGYTFDAVKTYYPEMVELLVDCVRNPAFLDWEVNETLVKVKEEIKEANENPQGLLMEAVHCAGYHGPLAHSLMANDSSLSKLNSSVLEEFVSEHYTAPRMVLAASGVKHEDLLSVAEPLLSDLPRVERHPDLESKYIGGDYRCQVASEDAHFALAFELPGGWLNERDAMNLTVLQILMGGGGSFSAGGPGKGMYSRLYRNVLNKYGDLKNFSAFNSIYNNTGLFGIYGTTPAQFAADAIRIACRELEDVATPGKVTTEELERAKTATKAAMLMNLESRMVSSEDIGRQILTFKQRKPVDHFLGLIDEIQLRDISITGAKLLSSPLTLASHGDVLYVPTYDAVQRLIR